MPDADPDAGERLPRWPRWAATAAVLALVLLGTAYVAGRQTAGPTGAGNDAARLGPEAGETVAGYLDRVRATPDRAAGDAPRLALVQLDAASTPDAAAAALAPAGPGAAALQVVLRVPLPRVQTALRRLDLGTDAASAPAAAARAATGRAAALATDEARRAPPGRARDVAAAEARALSGGVPALVALVVRTDPARVDALRAAPGVRAVEVAPPGAPLARLAVSPLLPEQGEGRPYGPVVGPVPDDGPVPPAGT